eukprot:6175349-Ditylum_brightwellii.AAC.1
MQLLPTMQHYQVKYQDFQNERIGRSFYLRVFLLRSLHMHFRHVYPQCQRRTITMFLRNSILMLPWRGNSLLGR